MTDNNSIKNHEYLMNIASIIYFICYIPEFYANWRNKNSNMYNVVEKMVMVVASSFAFSYAMSINNDALIINYAPILTLDIIGLFMRGFYAWRNRNKDVRVLELQTIDNPIHDMENI